MWISSLFRRSDVCAWYGISCDATDGSCLWSNKNIQIVAESLNRMPPGSTLPYFISSKVWCIETGGPFTVELERRSFSWVGSLIRTLVCLNLLYIWALNVSPWIFYLASNGVDGLHVGWLFLALDQNPHGGTLGIVEISCSPFLVLKPMDIAAIFGLSWMFLHLISCPLRYLTLS